MKRPWGMRGAASWVWIRNQALAPTQLALKAILNIANASARHYAQYGASQALNELHSDADPHAEAEERRQLERIGPQCRPVAAWAMV